MARDRAVGIVIRENKLLVMFRKNNHGEYYVFPGGGVEDGETNEQATVRELDEETSVEVKTDRLLYTLHHDNGDTHYFFLCSYISGAPQLRAGTNEYDDNVRGNDYYEPRWLAIEEINKNGPLYPPEATDQFLKDLKNGFSDEVVSLQSAPR
ncbi:MAG: NUDIX domain-containing protein [Candidatus Microsaccharimonas sp.]